MSGRCLCMRESSKNLLKTVKAKCVWIITSSSNGNRKFLMNENAYLNVSEAAEIDKCWLNLLTNVMKTLTPSSVLVFKGDEFNCLLCWFVFTHYRVHSIRLLKKVDNYIITMLNLY